MKWKNKLKMFLAETADGDKTEKYLKKELTITDKTQSDIVSSVIVSSELAHFPENYRKSGSLPKCSNCDLEMTLIENNTLLFCPLGCESRKADQ